MIIVKEEFTAGQFDLEFVKIYSTTTTQLKDKSGKIYKATKDKPLIIEKCRHKDIKERL